MAAIAPDPEILARPGGNDRVAGKKVLLAHLAREEAERLGIVPGPAEVQALGRAFLDELGLKDDAAIAAWIAEIGLSEAQFETVMTDLACVLVVETHYGEPLASRTELHRRFMSGRTRRLAQSA